MDVPRIKVVFDREIHEKKDAEPSLILVNPVQYPRISDFCERLIYLFDLSNVCPHGITLSIDGDIILPSESSHVLKETDIVRVVMTEGPLPGIVPKENEQIDVKEESYEGQEQVKKLFVEDAKIKV